MLCANSIDCAVSTLFIPSVTVVDRQRVSGGDINRTYRMTLSNSACLFLKCNRPDLPAMFTAEAEGLNALRATGIIGVPEPPFPSLIHGDLWPGNALCGPDGKAWILDPAAYVAHFEADLAMTELFGGFPERFYQSYSEIDPIDNGYSTRRDLYNLYHLLNHLNLFGLPYLSNVSSIAKRYA